MRPQLNTSDRVIAEIARWQHGNVTRRQLLGAGITAAEIKHRLLSGALIAVHRGVYRVGHAAPWLEAAYHAAVLGCGDGSLLGAHAAAHHLGMTKGKPPAPEILTRTQRSVRGVTVHRASTLRPADRWRHHGIPCTSPARTLVDLAARMPADQLARVAHEAGVKYATKPRHVQEIQARYVNAPGAAKLRAVTAGDSPVVLSKLESGFLRLVALNRLAQPQTNRRAGSFYVDCRWPEQRVTVELNSYRFHNSRHIWERDHRREREAYGRGDAFRRYTWGDVFEHPAQMLAELGTLL